MKKSTFFTAIFFGKLLRCVFYRKINSAVTKAPDMLGNFLVISLRDTAGYARLSIRITSKRDRVSDRALSAPLRAGKTDAATACATTIASR